MGAATAKKHDFNFKGGNSLRRIGASYYVCYLYSLNKDPNETRWNSVSTKDRRNKNIMRILSYSTEDFNFVCFFFLASP